jgi:hypothetical protein
VATQVGDGENEAGALFYSVGGVCDGDRELVKAVAVGRHLLQEIGGTSRAAENLSKN